MLLSCNKNKQEQKKTEKSNYVINIHNSICHKRKFEGIKRKCI